MGRSDIVIKDRKHRIAAVLEAKISDSAESMPDDCEKALHQIAEKKYSQKITADGFKKVISYGIAFYKKDCLVKIM